MAELDLSCMQSLEAGLLTPCRSLHIYHEEVQEKDKFSMAQGDRQITKNISVDVNETRKMSNTPEQEGLVVTGTLSLKLSRFHL